MSVAHHGTMLLHEVLRDALASGRPRECNIDPGGTASPQYAMWRLLRAWHSNGTFGPDESVLLRQVVRWMRQPFFVGDLPPAIRDTASVAGVEFENGALHVKPYRPSWLPKNAASIDDPPELRTSPEHVPCETFRPGDFGEWHSQAQKEATWAAMTAVLGSTTLIALPTGAGKSTCFHLLPWLGTGLTVVIVPTVALAIDQHRKAQSILARNPSINPLYYASGDPLVDSATVVEAIRNNRTRLLFTSPESCVSGSLKPALMQAAQAGQLANIVVDEAHLIETWGMFFRVDFQLLAAERRKWVQASGASVRTLLLSATFTPTCRQILQRLFHDQGQEWNEFVSQRLRPEVNYFIRRFESSRDRDDAVVEAAWMLPRPAIFYTTEPDEAEALKHRLMSQAVGFRRVASFHGDTPGRDRRDLVYKWTSNNIDVIVATSAFGVGVDKQDVRTIVHSCLPENLNRFYQEVGRGGRDGYSSISLLMPTPRDQEVAKGLAPTLMKPKSLQERWKALLLPPSSAGEDHTWTLFPAARRTSLIGTHTGTQNELWNKRLLLQLQRAGKLDILGAHYAIDETSATESDWVEVRLKFPAHTPDIGTQIAEVRTRELEELQQGYRDMQYVLGSEECLSRTLQRMYGKDTVRVCGLCPWCQRNGRKFTSCPRLRLPSVTPLSGEADLLVVHDWPHPFRQPSTNAFVNLLRMLVTTSKLRRFVCSEGLHARLMLLFNQSLGQGTIRPFRLDAFAESSDEPPFIVRPDEPIIVLHIGEVMRGVVRLRYGRKVVHAFCGVDSRDGDGRFFLESEGARLLLDPSFLFQEF